MVWSSCPYSFLPDYGADICTETAQIYMATVSVPTPVPSMPLAGLAILSSLMIGTVFLMGPWSKWNSINTGLLTLNRPQEAEERTS